jgi:hypothetical protein
LNQCIITSAVAEDGDSLSSMDRRASNLGVLQHFASLS